MKKSKKKKSSRKKTKKAARSSPAKSWGKNVRFQKVLSQKREEILHIVKQKEKDITLGEIGDEADVASQTFEREMIFEMADGERVILDQVEAALRKIEKGDFGICENCHKHISKRRLKAMPWARYCIQCQSRAEAPV